MNLEVRALYARYFGAWFGGFPNESFAGPAAGASEAQREAMILAIDTGLRRDELSA
jgi:hypothetical protein